MGRAEEHDLRFVFVDGICHRFCIAVCRVLRKQFILQKINTVCTIGKEFVCKMVNFVSDKYCAYLCFIADLSGQLMAFSHKLQRDIHQFSLSLLCKDPYIFIAF